MDTTLKLSISRSDIKCLWKRERFQYSWWIMKNYQHSPDVNHEKLTDELDRELLGVIATVKFFYDIFLWMIKLYFEL